MGVEKLEVFNSIVEVEIQDNYTLEEEILDLKNNTTEHVIDEKKKGKGKYKFSCFCETTSRLIFLISPVPIPPNFDTWIFFSLCFLSIPSF